VWQHDVSDPSYMRFDGVHALIGPRFRWVPPNLSHGASYVNSSQHMAHDFVYPFLVGGELQSSEVTTTFRVVIHHGAVTFTWSGGGSRTLLHIALGASLAYVPSMQTWFK